MSIAAVVGAAGTNTDHINDIGIPGTKGFGLGIAPTLPSGMTSLTGYDDPTHDNYGNYQYQDGSIMCWIPAFYYKFVGPILIIKRFSKFVDVAHANANGYTLHRAFFNKGEVKNGFFLDKYEWSKNNYAGNDIASSIKNGITLTEDLTKNPYSGLTGLNTSHNNDSGTIAVAKTRGSKFFPYTRMQFGAMGFLSYAHSLATSSTEMAAWYVSEGCSAPRGNDDGWKNPPISRDDTALVWEYDGLSAAGGGKTGSAGYGGGVGNIFAKSTHNGQNCGVADLVGNLWEQTPGLTSLCVSRNITGITKANPCVISLDANHNLSGNNLVAEISDVAGMTELNTSMWHVSVVSANTISLDNINSTSFGTYTSNGSIKIGKFYGMSSNVDMTTATKEQIYLEAGIANNFIELNAKQFIKNGGNIRLHYGDSVNPQNLPFWANTTISDMGWLYDGLLIPRASGVGDGGTNNFYHDDYYKMNMFHEQTFNSGGAMDEGYNSGMFAICGAGYPTYGDIITGSRSALFVNNSSIPSSLTFAELGTVYISEATNVSSMQTTISNVEAGDLILVFVERNIPNECTGVAADSPSMTFTKLKAYNASASYGGEIWAAIAPSSASSVVLTASYSTAQSWGEIFSARWTWVNGPGTIILNASGNDATRNSTSTNRTISNIITTERCLIVIAGSDWNSYRNHTAQNGFTKRLDSQTLGTNSTLQYMFDAVVDAGTYPNGNFSTVSSTDEYASCIIAIQIE